MNELSYTHDIFPFNQTSLFLTFALHHPVYTRSAVMKPFLSLLYYKYVRIEDAEQFAQDHLRFCKS
ncbi:MAG: hypothetical protein KBF32_11575, partial [Chitinophagales bacterium]|nr:hypothetical protein [Chitinophagales bacterium]